MMIAAWRYGFALALIAVCVSDASGQSPALTIEQVVARFLERNLAVEAARHRVDIARAEQIAAQLRPNPTLTLSAENVKFAGPTPAGDLYEVGATWSQPIERSDKRRHRREVADATVAVAEAEFAEALSQRLHAVKRAFYETLLARRAVEQAVDNLRAFDGLVAVTEARFKEGAVAEGEVLKVRLERARFDNALANAQLRLRHAGIKLLDLLGETDFSGAGAVTGDPVLPIATVPDVTVLTGRGELPDPRRAQARARTVPEHGGRLSLRRSAPCRGQQHRAPRHRNPVADH